MKTALKDRSALFNRLNNTINPLFDKIIERIVSSDEIGEAKQYAIESNHMKAVEANPPGLL